VVASIKPIHSLVAAVMAGVGEPALIVSGGASVHTYTLRPTDAEHLDKAQLIFWVGPVMESFLAKPLKALAGGAEIVELDRAPGVASLKARVGGLWEKDADEPTTAVPAEEIDGHLWLDPANAKAIARVAAARLGALDPAHAGRYATNAAALERRLDALDADLKAQLAPVRGVPFVVFHDAYQYFDRRYGLDAIGSITVSPEKQPGARRNEEIRRKVSTLHARCVFSEPQFPPTLVRTVIDDTGARTGVLDPEGAALPAGPGLYAALMQALADSLVHCLMPAR
jgi:zinc transport system substrate-binding protein